MTRDHLRRPTRGARLAAGVAAVAALLAGCAGAPQPTPSSWITATAQPLATTAPSDPLDDLAPLRAAASDADVVGLGESVHGAAQELTLKHRALRVLVEQLGFRSVAWEEDWTTGRRIDDYITTGNGDLAALMARMSPQWQTREVADVLAWLREFNTGRPDKVRFVGVEYYLTGADAYTDIDTYLAATAPDRLAELRTHLDPIRPATDDVFAHIQSVTAAPDKQPLVEHARAVHALVATQPHSQGDQAPRDREWALAEHTAAQIVSFYEHLALPQPDSHTYRDAHAAANLVWWRERTGDRIAYWAAAPHTTTAPEVTITAADGSRIRFAAAGSQLRERYGPRYLSVGFLFDHGSINSGDGSSTEQPPPAQDWFEHPLDLAGHDAFLLDLRRATSDQVRTGWLDVPITTRGPMGPGSLVTGAPPTTWFDLVVHVQQVTPAATP